ncbi:MAG TPA: OsmC family protein [Methylomirabilota bacterium]|nr:OsmC family protein [Methylomirabilota bacterium]
MAESRVFYYETEIDWQREKEGQLRGPGLPPLTVGAPPEFNGREGNWTPEHLFVASVNTCFMLTFLAIAENSKLPMVSFSSTAKGKLEKVEGAGYQITEIVIKPRVVIGSHQDLARMPRILEKAKENCFVTASIKSRVKVEPEIFHHQTQTSPCPLGEAPHTATTEPKTS